MPSLAWVSGDLVCDRCGVTNEVTYPMTWGATRGVDPYGGIHYRVGNALVWYLDEGGSAPPHWPHPSARGWNGGDPAIRDIDVLFFGNYLTSNSCKCGYRWEQVLIQVRGGIIVGLVSTVDPIDRAWAVEGFEVDPLSGERIRTLWDPAIQPPEASQ